MILNFERNFITKIIGQNIVPNTYIIRNVFSPSLDTCETDILNTMINPIIK